MLDFIRFGNQLHRSQQALSGQQYYLRFVFVSLIMHAKESVSKKHFLLTSCVVESEPAV